MHAITRLKDLFFLSQKVDSVLLGVAFSVGEMFQDSFK